MVNRPFLNDLRYRHILFRFQRAPMSRAGAKCYLPHCDKRIRPGEYRISLDRPDIQSEPIWGKYSGISILKAMPSCIALGFCSVLKIVITGTYHIDCFEELLDMSSPKYALAFEPDLSITPVWWNYRSCENTGEDGSHGSTLRYVVIWHGTCTRTDKVLICPRTLPFAQIRHNNTKPKFHASNIFLPRLTRATTNVTS